MELIKTGEFQAKHTTGEPVTIEVWQEAGIGSRMGPMLREFRLPDGRAVARIIDDDGCRYRLDLTGETFTSDDPNQPRSRSDWE